MLEIPVVRWGKEYESMSKMRSLQVSTCASVSCSSDSDLPDRSTAYATAPKLIGGGGGNASGSSSALMLNADATGDWSVFAASEVVVVVVVADDASADDVCGTDSTTTGGAAVVALSLIHI